MRTQAFIESARQFFAELARDNATDDSEDQRRQSELCVIMWWFRHVVLGVAIAHAAINGQLGGDGLLIPIALLTDSVGHLIVRRRPEWSPRATIAIAISLIVYAGLGLHPLLVLLLGVATLGWSASFRPTAAAASYLGVMLAVVTVYVTNRSSLSLATAVVGFCILALVFTFRTIRFNIAGRRAANQQRRVDDELESFLWEQIPGEHPTVRVSAAAERVLGHPAASWTQPNFPLSLMHPEDLVSKSDEIAAALDAKQDFTVTYRIRHADGSYLWMENRVSSVTDRNGKHMMWVGIMTDRTQEVTAQKDAELFSRVMETSAVGHLLLRRDDSGLVVAGVNGACADLIFDGEDRHGLPLEQAVPSPRVRKLFTELVTHAEAEAEPEPCEFRGHGGSHYQLTGRLVDDAICAIDFYDVTARVESATRLEEQALSDELTGLPNRRHFVERLETTIEHGQLIGQPTAILMLDLDDFKEINDSLGHETGDQLLQSIADRMRGHFDGSELLARLGGDEFAVVLPRNDAAQGERRAEELIALISQPVMIGDLQLRVRASAGVAACPEDATDAVELLRRADVAMYQAKSRQTGHQLYDASSDPFGIERVTMVGELETAILDNQLVLHHQPIYDQVGTIAGSEALVRWNHPRRGMIPPLEFIELAEVSGQMRSLTRWVIRQALSDLAQLSTASSNLSVSCNLSMRNLYEPEFTDWLETTLRRTGIAPERLALEITETTIMDDLRTAREVLSGLRDLGVKIWIDDFGTGHSSFARLRSLPIDGVKIDRSFVEGSSSDRTDRIVLRSLIELVHSLGLTVVAEGVEEQDALDFLRAHRCDFAQGFHLARPLPVADLHALLELNSAASTVGTT